ncbi:unnamed protein product [Urochloa humidicola]
MAAAAQGSSRPPDSATDTDTARRPIAVGGMDCSEKQASTVGDIPEGPLMEILSRVPAKSVCRFKCVSKAWRDLIADPHHRKKLPQAMHGLFFHTYKKSEAGGSYSFSFIDLAVRSVPLSIDPSFSFLTEQPGIRFLYFSDSCNGLVLFEHLEGQPRDSARLGYIVCNPTTKEWKAVPAFGSLTFLTYSYVAFNPAVSSHFYLVQFQVDDEEFLSVHAYSSETGTWSHNQTDEQEGEGQLEGWHQVRFDLAIPNPRCPFVNGFLHLLVWSEVEKILAFDVHGKLRRMITVPHVPDNRRYMCYFGQSQGQLHYMTRETLDFREGKYKLSIWVLQDYDANEWVLKCTVNTHEVLREDSCTDSKARFEVVDIHQDRDVVFFFEPVGHKLVAYDMGNKEVSIIATFDGQERLVVVDTARYVPCF